MVGNPRLHRWRDSQRLMDSPEVVVHEVECHGMFQVLNLLGKRVREPGKAPHTHPHREVLALNERRADVVRVGVTLNGIPPRPDALGGAIAGIPDQLGSVQLHEHGVVDLEAEGIFHGIDVDLVPVRRELDAIGKPSGQIRHKLRSAARIPLPHEPARDDLRVSAKRCPGPYVPKPELPLQVLRDVLLLRVAEGPNLIALNPATGQVPKVGILVLRGGLPNFGQEAQDGPLRHAGHAAGRTNAVSLDEGGNNGTTLLFAQSVHTHNMHDRSSIVKYKIYPQGHSLPNDSLRSTNSLEKSAC